MYAPLFCSLLCPTLIFFSFFLPQALAAQEAAPPAEATSSSTTRPSSAGTCVVIDGQEYSIEQFENFLASRFGPQAIGEFVDHVLLQREAQRLGVTIAEEAVTAEVDRRLEGLRSLFPDGGVAASLGQRRATLSGYRQWLTAQVRWELALASCIASQRSIDDAAIAREFANAFGPDGVARELRHVLVSPRMEAVPVGQVSKAQEILAQVQGGADFAELAQRHSLDPVSAEEGGTFPHRQGAVGPGFERSLAQLVRPGDACVAQSPLGLHVVQLVSLRTLTIEEVRPQLIEQVRQRPPTPTETALFFQALRQKASVQLP